ncbi:helix-turn-helix transcriptional regulator [Mucilaginibacter sp. FT3.2]|uniref:helix-turn-helix transcriptional regulator n=1 Tax=Mucilaginibacter sp. FT3.2 TaxID=2723090 RepID=UPI001621D984|nr:AraC family transcriptional regulator [Mucilaginibacter sp. FT3.2]MBB6233285.1 AraC-like DNA-binding protein [Mucilaginibacter sp. FT3.2]
MRITFTSPSQKNEALAIECPEDYSSEQLPERSFELPLLFGELHLRQNLLNGASIILTELDVKKTSKVKIVCDGFCWIMNFVIGGEAEINIQGKEFKLTDGRYHTFYTSLFNADICCRHKCRLLTICLSRNFIKKIFGGDELPHRSMGNVEGQITSITKGIYLKGRLEHLLNDILNAGQQSYIKRIFLEAKILELLSYQLQQLENSPAPAENLNTDDKARLHEARLLVEQNLKTPCSLIELSRKTGLNDFKLKKGFKILFGNTVFGYLGELRMTTAYQLLQNGQRVSTVAETVGYRNPHHFTAAFKKRYKILPSQVMQMVFLLINWGWCV